jgi:hypothetical protein
MSALGRRRQLTRLGRMPDGSSSNSRTVNSPWMPVNTVEVGATGIILASIVPHAMLNVMSVGRQAIIEECVKAKADQDHLRKEETQWRIQYKSRRYETVAVLTPLP